MIGSHLSRGADMAAQRARALTRAMFWMLITSMFLGACAAVWTAKKQIKPSDWPWFMATGKAAAINVIDWAGRAMILPDGSQVNSLSWFERSSPWVVRELKPVAITAARIGGAWAGCAFALLIMLTWWRGRRLASARFVRGGKLVSAFRLRWMLRLRLKASDIRIGNVPLEKGGEVMHLLCNGGPGTGKSQLIASILSQIGKRQKPCVIYDKKTDFVRWFYRPERGDIVLNPLDARCPSWDPWREARHSADFDRIAAAIIPPGVGEGQYWHDTARSLLSNAMLKLWDDPERDVPSLLRIVLNGSLDELAALLSDTDAQILLNPENQRTADSVRSTLNTYLRALRFLPRPKPGETPFSMRDWVESGAKNWVFITSNGAVHQSLKPLISCWCDCLIASVLSLQTDHTRRFFLSLDELPSLQRLGSLASGLSEGRGYGLSVIMG